jgi:Holliday junction resolvase
VNSKAKGAKNERRSMRLLEAAGYACTRSAASLGEWDIIGVSADGFVLVQVKTRDFPGAEEMETLEAFRCPANCRKLIHRWKDRSRLPDIKEL